MPHAIAAEAVLGLIVLVVLSVALGNIAWSRRTTSIRRELESRPRPDRPASANSNEMDRMPEPVQRYLRRVIPDGGARIAAVTVAHRGEFNMSQTGERWRPFTSTQRIVLAPPGFDWDARIRLGALFSVRVRDAYVRGRGILRASAFGVVPVMRVDGDPGINDGELMRLLAESAWYPTFLLPGQGVEWREDGPGAARATLRDGSASAEVVVTFGPDDLMESVRCESRVRIAGGQRIGTPWVGLWSGYAHRDGFLVPTEGEAVWMLPSGPLPYWRGTITEIRYEWA